jgi:predicted methyltransferase
MPIAKELIDRSLRRPGSFRENQHLFTYRVRGLHARTRQSTLGLFAIALAAILVAPGVTAATRHADPVLQAVSDPSRPVTDIKRDTNRKPVEMLEFAEVQPGDKVADYAAGNGYFTRLFSSVVGPTGHVYASVPSPLFQYPNIVTGTAALQTLAFQQSTVSVLIASPIDAARFPEQLDLVWISQNYHDLKDDFMGPVDLNEFNRAIYNALKPGGLYVIVDHVAAPGSPLNVTDTLHRIDPRLVRHEIEAAGFQFVGESKVLANPEDPKTASVFDDSIRGRTDQFVYKFRKP